MSTESTKSPAKKTLSEIQAIIVQVCSGFLAKAGGFAIEAGERGVHQGAEVFTPLVAERAPKLVEKGLALQRDMHRFHVLSIRAQDGAGNSGRYLCEPPYEFSRFDPSNPDPSAWWGVGLLEYKTREAALAAQDMAIKANAVAPVIDLTTLIENIDDPTAQATMDSILNLREVSNGLAAFKEALPKRFVAENTLLLYTGSTVPNANLPNAYWANQSGGRRSRGRAPSGGQPQSAQPDQPVVMG